MHRPTTPPLDLECELWKQTPTDALCMQFVKSLVEIAINDNLTPKICSERIQELINAEIRDRLLLFAWQTLVPAKEFLAHIEIRPVAQQIKLDIQQQRTSLKRSSEDYPRERASSNSSIMALKAEDSPQTNTIFDTVIKNTRMLLSALADVMSEKLDPEQLQQISRTSAEQTTQRLWLLQLIKQICYDYVAQDTAGLRSVDFATPYKIQRTPGRGPSVLFSPPEKKKEVNPVGIETHAAAGLLSTIAAFASFYFKFNLPNLIADALGYPNPWTNQYGATPTALLMALIGYAIPSGIYRGYQERTVPTPIRTYGSVARKLNFDGDETPTDTCTQKMKMETKIQAKNLGRTALFGSAGLLPYGANILLKSLWNITALEFKIFTFSLSFILSIGLFVLGNWGFNYKDYRREKILPSTFSDESEKSPLTRSPIQSPRPEV